MIFNWKGDNMTEIDTSTEAWERLAAQYSTYGLRDDEAVAAMLRALGAERDALREALTALRAAITNENGINGCAILDTVWVSLIETAVDYIDAALVQKEPGA